MRKRVLLAWEIGAGLTHMHHLRGVGRALIERGCDVRYAGPRREAEPLLAAAGIAALPPPADPWPLPPRDPPDGAAPPPRGIHNMLDRIATAGLATPETAAAQIAWYDTHMDAWRPDLVIGEYGYMAGLAARGRVPFLAIGCTASTAPVREPVPPGFLPDGPRWSWTTDAFVATVNDGLARAARPPIHEPADVLRGAGQYVMAIPETDLYHGRRAAADALLPPMIEGYDPRLVADAGDEVFVYLHGFTQANLPLLAGLIACGRPVRLYLVDLDADNAEALAALGIAVETAPVPIADIVRRSRVVIHHGGGQMVALLLAAGVPQIVLAKHYDNSHAGAAVTALGVARWCWHGDVTTPWLVDAVEALATDAAARYARDLAPSYRALLRVPPAPIIADAALAILREAS